MAANTVALMDAVTQAGAFGPNPHKWADPDDLGLYPGEGDSEYNQYAYDLDGVKWSLITELKQLGVTHDTITNAADALPLDEPLEFSAWTTGGELQNRNNLFKYMVSGGHAGGLLTSGGSTSGALTLDNLYTLANNMVWCWHNLHSFTAWTDFLSGEYQYSDKSTAVAAQEFDYIPAYHSQLSDNFSHFSQILSLATNYDAANTTHNAQSIIYASINSASVLLISNNSPFAANDQSSTTDYRLGFAIAPTVNSMAMWLYTANGTAEINPAGIFADRPAGLEIDKVDGVHPAENMTPQEVYLHFLNRVNNYTYMVRSFMTDSPAAGDYEPLPGVTRANTFIYEAKDWLQQRAQALQLVDLMSRTTLPGGTSTAIQNAIANTS